MKQPIVRQARPANDGHRELWLGRGRAALRELEEAGGSLGDLEQAYAANPQAFSRLVDALRELGAQIDAGVAALEEETPAATVIPFPRR